MSFMQRFLRDLLPSFPRRREWKEERRRWNRENREKMEEWERQGREEREETERLKREDREWVEELRRRNREEIEEMENWERQMREEREEIEGLKRENRECLEKLRRRNREQMEKMEEKNSQGREERERQEKGEGKEEEEIRGEELSDEQNINFDQEIYMTYKAQWYIIFNVPGMSAREAKIRLKGWQERRNELLRLKINQESGIERDREKREKLCRKKTKTCKSFFSRVKQFLKRNKFIRNFLENLNNFWYEYWVLQSEKADITVLQIAVGSAVFFYFFVLSLL